MTKMKNNFKNEVNSQSSLTINKNIALFLYEKVKNADLDPKYVPDKYLNIIKELLLEEKRLKTDKLNKFNKL